MVKRRTWLTRALTFLLTISMNVQSVVPAGVLYAQAAEDGKAKTEAAAAAEADAGEAVEEETESEAPAKALLSEEMTDASGNETDVPVAESNYDGDARNLVDLVIDDADADLPILHKQMEGYDINIEKLYKAKYDNAQGKYVKSDDLAEKEVVIESGDNKKSITFQLYLATVKAKGSDTATYYKYAAVEKIEGATDTIFTEAGNSKWYNAINDNSTITFPDVWDGEDRHVSVEARCETIGAQVFKGKNFTNLQIPGNITYIAESAFADCKNLNNIQFHSGIIGIDKGAFSGCSSLTYANVKDLTKLKTVSDNTFKECSKFTLDKNGTYEGLPENITYIGESAFEKTNIVKVSVPAKVTVIGKSAFKECNALNLLEGCTGVEVFGANCFENCTMLNGNNGKLPVTDKVILIGNSAFKGCKSFANMDLGNATSLVTIGNNAFENCTGLKTFVFPKNGNLQTIGNSAFQGCTSLNSQLTLPNTVSNIGNSSFKDCKALEGINLGTGLEHIGGNAFDSSGIKTIAFPPSITMLGGALCQNCKNLTWVSYTAGWDISILPDYAFNGCEKLVSFGPENNGKVVIPEKVFLFRENVFTDCKSITEVSLPNDQDIYIQTGVFKGCSSLKRIDFPEKTRFESAKDVTIYKVSLNIDDSGNVEWKVVSEEQIDFKAEAVCQDCTSLTDYSISGTYVGAIPKNMFYGCSALTKFNGFTGTNVSNIRDGAFAKCTSLKGTVVIPEKIEALGYGDTGVFEGCTGIESVQLNKKLTKIDKSTFKDCKALESIDFGGDNSNIKIIENDAFKGCSSLKAVTIPKTITGIGENAFSDCTSLTKINFPYDVASGGEQFNGVGKNAFSGCTALTEIQFPASLGMIDEGVFQNCKALTKVYLGKVQDIKKGAFRGCEELMLVYYQGTPLERETLEGTNKFNGDNDYLCNAYWMYNWDGEEPKNVVSVNALSVVYTDPRTGKEVTVSDNDTVKLMVGTSADFKAITTPDNATFAKIAVWNSSQTATATISYNNASGDDADFREVTINALAKNSTDITVKTADGPKIKFKLEVTAFEYDVIVDDTLAGATISADKAAAAPGTVVTISCNLLPGFVFNGWSVSDNDGNPVNVGNKMAYEKTDFRMPEGDVFVSALVEAAPVAVAAGGSTSGSIKIADGTYHAGDTVTVTAAPKDNYTFTGIKVNFGNGVVQTFDYDSSRNDNTVSFVIPAGVDTSSISVTGIFKAVTSGMWATIENEGSIVYTGKAIKPVVNVYFGGERLTLKKDYTISYKNNKNAFDATGVTAANAKAMKAPHIVIKGKGAYKGTKIIPFTIARYDLSNAETVDMAYASGAKKHAPLIMMNGKKLKAGKDYKITDASGNAIDVKGASVMLPGTGTFQVTYKGEGNFTGNIKSMVTVSAGTNIAKLKVTAAPITYSGVDASLNDAISITVMQGGAPVATLNKANGFTAAGLRADFINAVDPKKGTVYILPTADSNYCGQKKAAFKINPIGKLTGVSVKGGSISYNGGIAVLASSNFVLGGKELIEGKDYSVTYKNNAKAGIATATLTGLGGYKGSKAKVNFTIDAMDIALAEVTVLDEGTYDASGKYFMAPYDKDGAKPNVALTIGGVTLVEGRDYKIGDYKNNTSETNTGTAESNLPSMTITGKGNYKGSLVYRFIVIKRNCSNANNNVSLSINDAPISGGKVTIPDGVLKDSRGKELSAGNDYDATFTYTVGTTEYKGKDAIKAAGLAAGTRVKVTVTMKGMYTGSVIGGFTVVDSKNQLKSAKCNKTYSYTGEAIVPDAKDFTVTARNGAVLTAGTDYIVESCENNTNKGTAKVVIRGVGSYGGRANTTFKITPADINVQ
ncbi:MAG: leucine-rich repeat domain-containing protein [Lachnospiraceae bacterium]|nr:leucine-rich repeat domain-containing protein [Lachnospiraceae bacterium]